MSIPQLLNQTDALLWYCCPSGQGFVGSVLALLVADGLSRYNSHAVFDKAPSIQIWVVREPATYYNKSDIFGISGAKAAPTNGTMPQWLAIYVLGYSYWAGTHADYLATLGVCVYVLLIVCYLAYISCRRQTSSTWESVTELLVLCQNSPPPAAGPKNVLNNASSGIDLWHTYRPMVKVRAFANPEDPEHPKLDYS